MKENDIMNRLPYTAPAVRVYARRTTGLLATSPRTMQYVGDVDKEEDVL